MNQKTQRKKFLFLMMKLMDFLWVVLLGITVVFVSLSAMAVTSSSSTMATTAVTASDELQHMLNNIKTMQADFVQTTLSNNASARYLTKQKVTGKMILMRPGKFRWEMLSPTRQLIIANGRYVWVYDVDLEQVTKQLLDNKQLGNPAQLLSGDSVTLRRTFDVERLSVDADGGNDDKGYDKNVRNDYFELRPKAKNSMYSWIRLLFINGKLSVMTMEDNLGQKNKFSFVNVLINSNVISSSFVFVVPRGVDVIDNAADEDKQINNQ